MFDRAVETLPWVEQRAADDVSFRSQVAYLFERSLFYRDKLADAGFPDAGAVGGLAAIAALPSPRKARSALVARPKILFGTHLCVERSEIVRIFSTSGTTGTPSYIPLTRGDLDNWETTSARSYSTAGLRRGDTVVSTYNAGPFVAGAALGAFDRLGVCHVPVGTGNTDRLMSAIRLLRPTAAVLTPSYASHLIEWAADRDFDLKGSSASARARRREPGGGEPAMRARLEEGWGAKVTEAMGIGDIGVSLWGECEHQNGMHLGGRGIVHAELVDPQTGAAIGMEDGARGELVLTHLRHRAAPLLRFRTRDHVQVWTSPCSVRPNRAAAALHRPHRRHADRARRQRLPYRHTRDRRRVQAGNQRADPGHAGERRASARSRPCPSRSNSNATASRPTAWLRLSPGAYAKRLSSPPASSWFRSARCSAANISPS